MTATDSLKTRLVDRFDSAMQTAEGLKVDVDEKIKKEHVIEKVVESNDGDEEMDGSDIQEEEEVADNDADSLGAANDAEDGTDKKDGKGTAKDQDESSEEEEDGDEEEEEGDGKTIVQVGGRQKEKAYALLDGMFEDIETGVRTRVTIPITRFPATLGRSHDTDDPHFFGLGKIKALSRRQCRIYYRDPEGGQVGQWDRSSAALSYKAPADVEKEGTTAPSSSANMTVPIANSKLIKPGGEKAKTKPPSTGFFAIESLGKNRILVDRDRVDQGFSARLESGSAIRISTYMLYFLLPTDAEPKSHFVPDPNVAAAAGGAKKPGKKRKTPSIVPSSVPSSPGGSAAPTSKKPKTLGPTFQAELDSTPVDTLIQQMADAVNRGEWQRSTQLIGSSICLHAVRDAARDAGIQEEAVDVGVSRTSIMSWIETSDRYSEWVKQMLSKMEARSYQAAITKSLLKAGFTRTGSSGRYIKWLLPKDIPITFAKTSKKKKSTGGGSGKTAAAHGSPGKSPKKKAAVAAPKAPPVEEEEQDDADEESENEEQADDESNQEENESGDDENEENEEEEVDDDDDDAGDNEKEDAGSDEDGDDAAGDDKEAVDDDNDDAEDGDDKDDPSDDDDEEGNVETKDDGSGDENEEEED